jgi:hypothetical protein
MADGGLAEEPATKKMKRDHEGETNQFSQIKCFYDQENEKEIILKVSRGEIVSSLMYPLLFDVEFTIPTNEGVDNAKVYYRSLPFLRSIASGTADYHTLDESLKYFVHIGLRDLYFASLMNLLTDGDKEILLAVTNLIPDSEKYMVDGLSISFHPSVNRKVLKYMHIPAKYLRDTNSEDFFIQPTAPTSSPSETETSIRAVFVDPRDLSYHNFESIVRLDSWFKTADPIEYATTQPRKINPNFEIFTFHLTASSTSDPLHQLDNLDLYTPPLNASTRGGNRFIFQSHLLSAQLTQMIRSCGVLKLMSPSNPGSEHQKHSADNSFIAVNSVFRLNKFIPGDRDFEDHLDTPYSDPAHHQFSRYSLLLYLSGGVNTGTLSFEDEVSLDEINDLTCVIFRQDYEHRGKPFLNSNKIFLRSELIFHIEDDDKVSSEESDADADDASTTPSGDEVKNESIKGIRYENRIGKLFTSAVYFTGQSIYEPELSRYAHKCYELSNRLHWNCQSSSLESKIVDPPPSKTSRRGKGKGKKVSKDPLEELELQLLLKQVPVSIETNEGDQQIFHQFVTCGSDYWFQRPIDPETNQLLKETHNLTGGVGVAGAEVNEDELYLKECVMFAIFDYFNCSFNIKKKSTPFRSLCETSILAFPSPSQPLHSSEEYETFIYSTLQSAHTPPPHSNNTKSTNKKKKKITSLSMEWLPSHELTELPFVNQKPIPKPNLKHCCPFHCFPYEDEPDLTGELPCLAKVPEVFDYYQTCRNYSEMKIRNSCLFFNWLGRDVIFNSDSLEIVDDKIYVLNKTTAAAGTDENTNNRVNFAACWNGGGLDSYLSVGKLIPTKRLLIPPIPFHSTRTVDMDHATQQHQPYQRVHLSFDFFQNNWSVTVTDRVIPIPVIQYNDEEGTETFHREVAKQFYGLEDLDAGEVPDCDLDGDQFVTSLYGDRSGSEASASDED